MDDTKKNTNNNLRKNISNGLKNTEVKIGSIFEKIVDKRIPPKRYTRGSQTFMSTKTLSRLPISFKNNPTVYLILGIAIVVCAVVLIIGVTSYCGKDLTSIGNVENNLNRQVEYQIPVVSSYLGLSKEEVETLMSANGFHYVDMPSTMDSSSSYDLYKLPSDVDSAQAKDWIEKGFTKISSANAAMLMKGGWQLSADKENTQYARVRYADFASENEKAAIDAALKIQAFENEYTTNDDVDELGNTYKAGTATFSEKKVSWRISAIRLKEVYDIGLPDEAIYVGIRVETM